MRYPHENYLEISFIILDQGYMSNAKEFSSHRFKLFSEGEILCLVCHIIENENLDILIHSEKIKAVTDNSEIKI